MESKNIFKASRSLSPISTSYQQKLINLNNHLLQRNTQQFFGRGYRSKDKDAKKMEKGQKKKIECDSIRNKELPRIALQMEMKRGELKEILIKSYCKLSTSFTQYLGVEQKAKVEIQKMRKIGKLKKGKEERALTGEAIIQGEDNPLDNTQRLIPLRSRCFDSPFPSHRYGASLVGWERGAILIGGYTLQKFQLLSLIHKYESQNGRWVQIKGTGQLPKLNPCYHTGQIYKNHLLVVGGVSMEGGQGRRFNHEILLLNLEKGEWLRSRAGIALKHHASTLFGSTLLVHGGINEKQKFNEEMYFLSLNGPGGLTAPAIFSLRNRSESHTQLAGHKLIHTYELDSGLRIRLPRDGVFCFGGEDERGQINNNLQFLGCLGKGGQTLDLKFKQWQLVPIGGQKPCPRRGHSLTMIGKRASALLVGGTDQLGNKLCDIWLLDLLRLQWIKIQTQPRVEDSIGYVAGHAACAMGSIVYIYRGGFEQGSGSQFWGVETDNGSKSKKSLFQTKLPSFKSIKTDKQNQSLWNINE